MLKLSSNNGSLNLKKLMEYLLIKIKKISKWGIQNYDKFVTEAYSIAYWRSENLSKLY